MTTQESQQALQQLQALYSMTRRVLTTADEHEAAKATAQQLAATLRPEPQAKAEPSSAVEKTVAQFTPKDSVEPARTRRGKVS
jgi:hypothetical protein